MRRALAHIAVLYVPVLVVLGLAAAAGVAAMMPGMGMGGSTGMTTDVQIQYASYAPAAATVLTGDTVSWHDVTRMHTVTSRDGSWSSPHLNFGDSYSFQFTKPGTYDYYCQIHTFMQGSVDVQDLLLSPQLEPVAPQRAFPLSGRAALPEGTEVTIEGDSGFGFATVGTATVAGDGTFVASVTPATTTTYRARTGATVSPPVRVRVLDRHVTLTAVRRGGRYVFTATVTPASPGATVVLQYWLRVRFGWWPEQQARANGRSQARFVTRLGRRIAVRAALTLRDGATVLALSPVLHVG